MNATALGVAVAAGLLALIPSKKEMEQDAPWASIALAVFSGIMAALAFSH